MCHNQSYVVCRSCCEKVRQATSGDLFTKRRGPMPGTKWKEISFWFLPSKNSPRCTSQSVAVSAGLVEMCSYDISPLTRINTAGGTAHPPNMNSSEEEYGGTGGTAFGRTHQASFTNLDSRRIILHQLIINVIFNFTPGPLPLMLYPSITQSFSLP